ncbi:MAG: nucleotidyltransferase domain-containing protein [Methanomicrobia archaeon]|nr:nucleotidyltransferase domain-containing protein [Methanomicrobia archaeon]
MKERYLETANKIVNSLKKDPNTVAVLVYGSLATDTLRKGSDIDLLVIVKKMPENLDIFNQAHEEIDGIMIDFDYATEGGLGSEIDFEVGCWLNSGMVMNAVPLHDPDNVLDKLKNHILSIPKEKKEKAFKTYIGDAQSYISKLKDTDLDDVERSVWLMREWAALSRALFILNDARPSSEDSLFSDILKLENKPRNFEKLFKTIYGLDINNQRLEEMRKAFFELYENLRELKF